MATLVKGKKRAWGGKKNGNGNTPENPLANNAGALAKSIDTDNIFEQGSWFGSYGQENIFKDLMEPGKDININMLRSIIRDEKQLNNMVLAWSRYDKFEDTRHKDMLKLKIIGMAGIHGMARLMAIMAYTGVIAPDVILKLLGVNMSKEERKDLQREIASQQQNNAPQKDNV